MRFCLRCRQFSGGGPLCTQCGRSFGGRLCQGRTRHINPYDAQFCNHCGTTQLLEGAASIPLGWGSRVIVMAVVFVVGRWLLFTVTQAQSLSFQSLTGYADVRIWLIEKFANFLIVLMVFSFLSSFIPGEAGKMFRSVMFGVVSRSVTLFFKILERSVFYLGQIFLKAVGIEVKSEKKKK